MLVSFSAREHHPPALSKDSVLADIRDGIPGTNDKAVTTIRSY